MKPQDEIIEAVLNEIDKVISILEYEREKRWPTNTKFKVGNQLPEIDSRSLDNKSIKKYQEEHGIKKDGNWTREYIDEALNSRYTIVGSHVIGYLRLLKQDIKKVFDISNLDSVDNFIKKRIKQNHKLIKSDHGNLYYDREYRNETHPLLQDRFDAFWFICEWTTLRPLPIKKRNAFNSGVNTGYPFIIIDLIKWGDFEQAYWSIPLLKELHFIVLNKKAPKMEKYPFESNTSIFNKDGEDILYTILLRSGVISKSDQGRIELTSKFRGACGYLFDFLQRPSMKVLKSISKIDFIQYLNDPSGYNAKILNPKNSIIANEKTKENASLIINVTLSELFPNLALD